MSDWQHIEINNHGTIVVLRPISDEGRRLYAFLAARGREGRRFAPRFWEKYRAHHYHMVFDREGR